MEPNSSPRSNAPTPISYLPFGRPRSGPIAPFLHAGIFIAVAFLTLPLFGLLFGWLDLFWMAALSSFGAGVAANAFLILRYGDGTLAQCGLSWRATSPRDLAFGLLLGAGSAIILIGGATAIGIASWETTPPSPDTGIIPILSLIGVLLVGAIGEELIFRGYGFQILAHTQGLLPPLVFFSIVFALAHLGNEDVTALGLINTGLWGALFAYTYWRSQSLYAPIAMHFGWNLMLPFLGVDLSGFTIKVTGYVLTWHVDDLWSGGGYGPEGSLLTTMLVVVLAWIVGRTFLPASAKQ